jgi:hypothetical protein
MAANSLSLWEREQAGCVAQVASKIGRGSRSGARETERLMREGYLAVRSNREQLNTDWKAIDVEGWPE